MSLNIDLEDIVGKSGSNAGVTRLSDIVSTFRPTQKTGSSSVAGTVVRGLLSPITAVDSLRRGVISGVRELVDAVDSDPNTKPSFTDFRNQTADASYGFGTAFPDPTGNKWVDRLVGFAGDVALDPITYATLGAGKVATLGGRAALSIDLIRAGQATGRVAEAAPLVERLSRVGVNGLNRAERTLFDDLVRAGRAAGVEGGSEIGQAGIRLRVPFTKAESGAIPGTRAIAEGLGQGLANTRSAIARTNTGTRLREALSPVDRVGLYNEMVAGGNRENLMNLLTDLSATTRQAGATRSAEARLLSQVEDIVRSGRKEGVSGEQVAREIASGAPDSLVAQRAQDFLITEGKALGDVLPEFGLREGGTYLPRVLTEAGQTLRSGDVGAEVRATLGYADNLAPETITLRRQLNAGDTISRGDKSVTLAGDDPFSFNKAMNELYPELNGAKFVEEDAYKLLTSWARDASSAYGRARYASTMVEMGVGKARNEVTREAGLLSDIAAGTPKSVEARVGEIQAGRRLADAKAQDAAIAAQDSLQSRVNTAAVADERAAARLAGQADRRLDEAYAYIDNQIDDVERKIAGLDQRAASIGSDAMTPDEVSFMRESLRRSRQQLEDAKGSIGDPRSDQIIAGISEDIQRLSNQADEYAARARNVRAGGADPRVDPARARAGQTAEDAVRARRALDDAMAEGFIPSLGSGDAAQRLADDVGRIPERGHQRLKREIRALMEDVPEGELLTGDEKYLAGLRRQALSGDQPSQVSHALLVDLYATEARLAAEGGSSRRFGDFFADVAKGKNSVEFRQNMLQQIEDGWRMIEGTGIAVPTEVYQIRQRLIELRQPQVFSGFMKAWEQYTKVFKAYVTATPRFHVRNGMSATMMNFSDGVRAEEMIEGVRIWKKFISDDIGRDVRKLDQYERSVIESVLATGGGQYDALEIGFSSPPGTKWSRRTGMNVEGAVRSGMAVSTIRNGGSFDEAVARITRVHFDYSQFSSVDRIARQVFPFWTFMSRNLPLQVTQMWTKPRAYARFNSFVRNIRTDNEETGVVPGYFTEGAGFRLPFNIPLVGQWARPDLGFSRVEEDAARLKDPIRFLADANPAIKALVEGFANKQLYKDIPLDDTSRVPLSGWQQALAPMLLALGYADRGKNGIVVTPKTEYLLDQFNPVGGLINRYSGEGSRDEGNALKNLFSATGVPALLSGGGYVRDLTPEVQAGEVKRRQFQQLEAIRKLQEIAKAS